MSGYFLSSFIIILPTGIGLPTALSLLTTYYLTASSQGLGPGEVFSSLPLESKEVWDTIWTGTDTVPGYLPTLPSNKLVLSPTI